MKGQILDYSVQDNAGIITTTEGPRYVFLGAEWKAKTVLPTRGMWVANSIRVARLKARIAHARYVGGFRCT